MYTIKSLIMECFFVFIKKSIVLYQHTILMHWLHHTVLCVVGIYGEVFLALYREYLPSTSCMPITEDIE